MTVETPAKNATRAQLRSLARLRRIRGVTLTRLADETGYSIAYLSEITRGLLPGGRRVTVAEFERIKSAIQELGR